MHVCQVPLSGVSAAHRPVLFLLVGGWGGEVKAGSYSDIQKMKHYDLVDLVPYTHQVPENHVHACNSR